MGNTYNFLKTSVENAEETFSYLLKTQSRSNSTLAKEAKEIKRQIQQAVYANEITKTQAADLTKRIEACDFSNIVKIRRGKVV